MSIVSKKKFSSPWKILCVEDNKNNMLFTTTIIKNHGGIAVEAWNGKEAVEICSKEKFDKILMDLTMPVMNGFDAASIIKNTDGPNKDTPILALTADLTEFTRLRCMDMGFEAYLTKPITTKLMFSALE